MGVPGFQVTFLYHSMEVETSMVHPKSPEEGVRIGNYRGTNCKGKGGRREGLNRKSKDLREEVKKE